MLQTNLDTRDFVGMEVDDLLLQKQVT